MTSKRELLERVVRELNLDLNDPFTLIFAHAAALSDACAELRKELKAARELSSGPLDSLERAVVDAAMKRLVTWKEQCPEGLLPIEHPRAILGTPRTLIEACLELEQARSGATHQKG